MDGSSDEIRVDVKCLKEFCSNVFEACGLSEEDALACADVLVAADMRGIPSHGVARLWRYVNGPA